MNVPFFCRCFRIQINLWCEDFSIVSRTLPSHLLQAPSVPSKRQLHARTKEHAITLVTISLVNKYRDRFCTHFSSTKSSDRDETRKNILLHFSSFQWNIGNCILSEYSLKVTKWFINYRNLLIEIFTSYLDWWLLIIITSNMCSIINWMSS